MLSEGRMRDPISPTTQVRYVKLGRGGMWEHECLREGTIRFGFGSANPDRYLLCRARRWDELTESFLAEGKTRGTATRFTNETRLFFEDDGKTLWITFIGEQLCWGFLSSSPPEPHPDGHGVQRKLVNGWSSIDRNGETLTKDRLSGALTKLAAYRGTSCTVDVADYVIRRINGEKTPQVERAVAALAVMRASVLEMMRLLGPRDFETLVDLVFATTGWRRLGPVGRAQPTLDFDLMLPTTEERAIVQVKSNTTSAELVDYIGRLPELGPYNRMFYVYHSGEATLDETTNGDEDEDEHNRVKVHVLGPEKLADLVVDAGLIGWLIRKVS